MTLTATPPQHDEGPVLLTGATGFVGMELLVRVLEQTDRDVVALVRADDDDAARVRIDELLQMLIAPARRNACRSRVQAVAADLEQPGLGLSATARAALVASIGVVVHCAASVSFTLELEDARRINVEGTREILRLASDARQHGSLDRFVHVSTAYVAGERGGRARERQGDIGQRFRNTYERTKLEAERLVHDSGLPAAIMRPSVIVGDSVTGWTPSFNVIYWPLQAFARGLFDPIPGDPDAPIDIVPVDVVADALLELLCGPVRCGTFHVVASDAAVTNERLATMAAEFFDAKPPRFAAPGEDPSAEMRAGPLVPYFRVRCVFDALRGRRALGAEPPPLEQYFPALMRYARDARWGKSPAARWAVGAGADALQRVA
jgi:long-chain acyl-CoA synthetase